MRGNQVSRGETKIYYYEVCIGEGERERKSYVLPFVTLNNLVNWATIQGSPSK